MSEEISLTLLTEKCFECDTRDRGLVKACGNKECDVKFHEDCLKKLVDCGQLKCTNCKDDIIITKTSSFKFASCIVSFVEKILFLFVALIGGTIPGLIIFGSKVLGDKYQGGQWEMASLSFSGVISFFGGLCIFWFVCNMYMNADNVRDFMNTKSGLRFNNSIIASMFVTCFSLFIIDTFIFICHGFGYAILLGIFGIKDYFNNQTFIAGLIPFLIVGGIILIIFGIKFSFEKLCFYYSEEETRFGVV